MQDEMGEKCDWDEAAGEMNQEACSAQRVIPKPLLCNSTVNTHKRHIRTNFVTTSDIEIKLRYLEESLCVVYSDIIFNKLLHAICSSFPAYVNGEIQFVRTRTVCRRFSNIWYITSREM